LNKKKIERSLAVPWRISPPLPISDYVTFTVINAHDTAPYGELFDPVETELILTASRESIPLLTDQFDMQDKLIEAQIPIQVYDVEDFEFAVEEGAFVDWEGR